MTVGFFGGKFCPFHKGHFDCVVKAKAMCDKLYVVLFSGIKEEELCRGTQIDSLLTVEARMQQIKNAIKEMDNVEFVFIDTRNCMKPDGEDDWYAEAELLMEKIGRNFDYVFSSEPSYDAFFKEVYPWAEHIIIDKDRAAVGISGTKIRKMTEEEARKWLA